MSQASNVPGFGHQNILRPAFELLASFQSNLFRLNLVRQAIQQAKNDGNFSPVTASGIATVFSPDPLNHLRFAPACFGNGSGQLVPRGRSGKNREQSIIITIRSMAS